MKKFFSFLFILSLIITIPAKACPVVSSTLISDPTLKAYYQLDGNANDYLGLSNGTAYNASWVTGKFVTGTWFNGSSSYIRLPTTQFTWTDKITVNFWHNFVGGSNQMLLDQWDKNGTSGYDIQCDGTKCYWQVVYASGSITVSTTLPTNGWHMFTGVYDGANQLFYIDGVLKDSRAKTGVFIASTDLYNGLGCYSWNNPGDTRSSYTTSTMDDVSFWDTGLSATVIGDLFATTSQGICLTATSSTSTYNFSTNTNRYNWFLNNYQNTIIYIGGFFLALALLKFIIDLTKKIWVWYNKL